MSLPLSCFTLRVYSYQIAGCFLLNLAVMMLVSSSNDVHLKSSNTVKLWALQYYWKVRSIISFILGLPMSVRRYSLFLLIKTNCYTSVQREKEREREKERVLVWCEWSYFWMIWQRCWHGGGWCSTPALDLRGSNIFLPSEFEVFNLSVKNFLNPFFRPEEQPSSLL